MHTPRITTDPAEQDIAVIHRFLTEESKWARGIPVELVRESVANSLNFGLFVGDAQVGYARVVTDYATFAYLLDVFVLDAHRGNGYSRQLMDAVIAHPKLQGLRRFMLFTSTAHGLYEKYGFAPPAWPDTMMEIMVPNAYGAR
ncbi:GNAT family N-acetyltransferase [Jeongeupia naejangsanensis]|uniref:GNAT family N-acetyltransferase n=1 Tax=Jeongeupia naejangsanensis TaxID=613195 RepID=A0ABS2BQ17_9NEIS|nr:GNAT family N-acetyltransferase [Jeongeupia naejangsanensis]MBM3117530.1 GNAT family N-acetyltransferase [Jeongeupia naejangsanensis]